MARWARVDREPPTCPFCIVLISRGAVYLSKDSAEFKDQAKFHTGDTCIAVLVPKGKETSFDGYAEQQAAKDEYIKATRIAEKQTLSGIVAAIEQLRSEGTTP